MIYRSASTPNASSCHSYQDKSEIDQINEGLFWTAALICSLIAVFGMIANGVVLYFVNKEPFAGALRHINTVVIHLAVANFLYGLLGCPLSLTYWKAGKNAPLPN